MQSSTLLALLLVGILAIGFTYAQDSSSSEERLMKRRRRAAETVSDQLDSENNNDVESSVDSQIVECLKKMPASKSVDVLIDIAPNALKAIPANMVELYGQDIKTVDQLPSSVAQHLADAFDEFSDDFALDKVHVMIQNGTVRNHVTLAAMVGNTTASVANQLTQLGKTVPEVKPAVFIHKMNTLAHALHMALNDYFNGRDPKLPTHRDNENATYFTVVITDGSQNTNLSAIPEPKLIFDIMGNYASQNPGYINHNLIIVHPPEMLFQLLRTARFQVCQHLGGVGARAPAAKSETTAAAGSTTTAAATTTTTKSASSTTAAASTTTTFYPTTTKH